MRVGLGVGDAGQRPSAADAVDRSTSADAADGGVPAQRERVVSGQGGLEERGRRLVPTSPVGVWNWG